jgi:hypothetical protein
MIANILAVQLQPSKAAQKFSPCGRAGGWVIKGLR